MSVLKICKIGTLLFLFTTSSLCFAQTMPYQAIVNDNENNIREFGGNNYKRAAIIGVLNKSDAVTVLEVQDGWAHIEKGNDLKGWVHSSCLTPRSPSAAPVPGAQTTPPKAASPGNTQEALRYKLITAINNLDYKAAVSAMDGISDFNYKYGEQLTIADIVQLYVCKWKYIDATSKSKSDKDSVKKLQKILQAITRKGGKESTLSCQDFDDLNAIGN